MINIVTGYKGVKHITSEQFADLNRSIFGNGNYILKNIGDGCNYNIVTNNEIQIQSGVFFIQGKQGEIDNGGISATIENGTQGMKRYDVICIKYTKDSVSNIENFEYETIKGVEDPNEYIIPEFDRGDIRAGDYEARAGVYGVKINGLAIEKVEIFSDINFILDSNKIKRNKLFDGSILNGTITLSDKITNYRFLIIGFNQAGSQLITSSIAIFPVFYGSISYQDFISAREVVPSEQRTIVTYTGTLQYISETELKIYRTITNLYHAGNGNHSGVNEFEIKKIWGVR